MLLRDACRLFQAIPASLVAVLLQILHEWRPSGADGMRILRIGLSLLEYVGRGIFEVQGPKIFESFDARVVGGG
jgi:hypothetical protein